MTRAINFSLLDQDSTIHTLDDYLGRWVVLYFYPKNNTPGCVTEACEFRDEHAVIGQFGNAAIIGVSDNSVRSHKKFATRHHLNFPLLSDPDHTTIEAYGAWQSKAFAGMPYKGTVRTTVLIDPSGTIAKRYENVVPHGHAARIINDLHDLQDSTITASKLTN
jgi:peroxiredoxin Q/BCP